MNSRLENIISKLRGRDFRMTPQREAVIRLLITSAAHPSAEQVHEEVKKAFPAISLATVYKTAALLREIGELSEISTKEGGCRFDGRNPQSHPHVICSGCKSIVDFDVVPLDDLMQEVARKTGYRLHDHRLDFFGICPRCARVEVNPTVRT